MSAAEKLYQLLRFASTYSRISIHLNKVGTFAVKIHNCQKDCGTRYCHMLGTGKTFEEACLDLYRKIEGSTLVFDPYQKNEVKVVFSNAPVNGATG